MPKLHFDTTRVTIYVHDDETGHYVPANIYTTGTMNQASTEHLKDLLSNNRFQAIERREVENYGPFAACVHYYDVFLTGKHESKEKARD